MSKKTLLGTIIIVLILISSEMAISQNNMFASAAEPSKLKISVGPTSVPADNNIYDCIAVQLQDAQSKPARATQDITISLSSSLTNIGDVVNPKITIPKGSTYATDQFKTTFSPGSTTITATASGFSTVQAKINTVGPIPSSLVVYGFPSTLPADSKSYDGTVIVQLQDSSGTPAKAPNEGVEVTLSSSNTEVGTVDETITIEGGQTYAAARFTTTMNPGTASVTAVASGYTSKQATFTTQTPETAPANLKIFLGPPKVPADRITYQQVAVEIQNEQGKIARAPNDITITLASSTPDVGTVESTVTVRQGDSYALANFDSTYKSGSTTITATATDFKTTEQTLTTVGNTPSKLAVYAVPDTLPSDSQTYKTIQVQLQDSSGKPAKDPNGDITVSLFSSTQDAGDVTPNQLTIPFGQTTAQGNFATTYTANSTTITAQASNYNTGQTKITTYLIDEYTLNVDLQAEQSLIQPSKNTTITAYVTYEGTQPASGVKLTFNSTKGGNFTTPAYQGNGTYTTVFTAPKSSTVCNITANVTKANYLSDKTSINITVSTSANPDAVNLGTLQFQISQENGDPITDAVVTSITQPTGAKPISGITNTTGYITFTEITAGLYELQITKSGYKTQEQAIVLAAGQSRSLGVTLVQEPNSLWLILVIVGVIAAVAIVAVVIFMRRRQRQKRFKKPPTLTMDYNLR